MKKNFFEIFDLFENLNVLIEVAIAEWVFSLFSSVIPLEVQVFFYEGFFMEGWRYFYKVCIHLFLKIDKTNFSDNSDVYIALKFRKFEKKEQTSKFWEDVCKKAYKIEISGIDD